MAKQFARTSMGFSLLMAGLLLLALHGCSKDEMINNPPAGNAGNKPAALSKADNLNIFARVTQVNLTSNLSAFSPKHTDANLQNAWGIAISPNDRFWISANHASVSVIYDNDGNTVRSPVNIPTTNNPNGGGAPTGQVFNSTQEFKITSGNGQPAAFIFAGEDGIISAWNQGAGSNAIIMSDRSGQDVVYKGLELAWNNGQPYLYATNFKGSTVEVFDKDFHFVTDQQFKDPNIPSDFGPFNIRLIDGNLYVTYAKHKAPDNMDDEAGVGNGYIDVYSTSGSLIKRFATQGKLNSPWGIEEASVDEMHPEIVLVGNFGDGRINVFSDGGVFLGQLKDNGGGPLSIDGLWALTFDHTQSPLNALKKLYFTAGPNDENDGLFGYLTLTKRDMKLQEAADGKP